MTEAYPLSWPHGWPRAKPHKRRYTLSGGHAQNWEIVCARLYDELRRLGAKGIILSTNQPVRRDGLPYAAQRKIEDPGAAVYFTLRDRQMVMAQDNYERLVDNIRSLALAIEGMRQMQRHGGDHMMERAFTGFEALPAPGSSDWKEVLGLHRMERPTLADAQEAYRRLARERHPDHGGSDAMMAELNAAIATAKEGLA